MAAHPIVTFHDGKLEVPEELQRELKLHEGSQLRVVAVSGESVTLQTEPAPPAASAWDNWTKLRGMLASEWTPEAYAAAVERKRLAQENLDRVYASGTAGATEIKAAEREWELADDELDFGPFSNA